MYESLKQEMVKQNIKTYTLAKKSEIASSDLYSALAGKRCMFPNWRKRISETLNVPEEDLFPESEVK
jgi:predicted transcriptional regulator